MKFKTIAEAFNYYRNATVEEIERRAAEIKGTIETDADADITTLNIELSGLAQAKENIQQQAAGGAGPDMGAADAGAAPGGDNVVDADYEVVDDEK